MSKQKSDAYWRDFIISARTSGLTDAMWCDQHDLSRTTFYYHVRKLRNKGIVLPESSGACTTYVPQEVVPVHLFEESALPVPSSNYEEPALYLQLNGIRIEIHNHAQSSVIATTLQVVKSLC